MMEHGVEPVQVFSFSSAVKNAADIEMVVDVLQVASEAPHVDVFVLVSGDGGFVPLVRRLHALGKYVMVATTRDRAQQSTSKLLQAVADHFLISGVLIGVNDVEQIDQLPVDQPDSSTGGPVAQPTTLLLEDKPFVSKGASGTGTATGEAPSLAEVAVYIRQLLYHTGSSEVAVRWLDQDGRIKGAALGLQVHKRWTGLTWSSLGYRSLGALIKEQFELEVQRPQVSEISGNAVAGVTAPPEPFAEEYNKELNPLGWVGLEARAALRKAIGAFVASQAFTKSLDDAGGSLKLSPVGILLKRALPSSLKEWAGFSSLTFALRYCLAGMQFCVIETDDDARELLITRRERAEREVLLELPEVSDDEIGGPAAVWELARRTTPPLVLVEPAILRDVTTYLLQARPTGSIIDLIDSVAEALPPSYEAAYIRGALNLMRRVGLLEGPADYLLLRATRTRA